MENLPPTAILRKTEAGLAAMKTFDRSMAAKTRTLLILIDGKKTVQELRKFSPDPTQIGILLDELIAGGYVGVVTQATLNAIDEAYPATLQAPLSAPILDLKTSIRKVTRALEDLLGPASEGMCLQVEKCKSHDELRAKVQTLRAVVASSRSEAKAQEFVVKALG